MRKGSKFVAFLLCISCLLGGIYIGAHYTGKQVPDAAIYVSAKLISTSQPTARNSSGESTSGGSSSQQSRTVYVSRTGECYHSYSGCSDMVNPLVMSEDEAIARGRRRCRKCW